MYTYRLHLEDGSDAGTATYAVLVKPGEEILVGNGRRFRVLDVVPFDDLVAPKCPTPPLAGD
jgi:hypothetical protein